MIIVQHNDDLFAQGHGDTSFVDSGACTDCFLGKVNDLIKHHCKQSHQDENSRAYHHCRLQNLSKVLQAKGNFDDDAVKFCKPQCHEHIKLPPPDQSGLNDGGSFVFFYNEYQRRQYMNFF